MEYHSALLLSAHGEKNVTINTVPDDSTFGQWWRQLHDAFQSSDVLQWIRAKGIDRSSITLDPHTGQISFRLKRELDPQLKLHTVGQDDSEWAAISGPILQAARVIDAGTSFTPPALRLDAPVPWWIIGRFYQEPQRLTQNGKRARAQQIERGQGFKALDPLTVPNLIKTRSDEALEEQRTFLADIENRHAAANSLRHLATSVEHGIDPSGQIGDELKKPIDISPEGTYRVGESNRVSLVQFLQDHGWDIPTTHEQLLNLATALSTPSPKAPAHGNLGGALAWPVPLDQAGREQLKAALRSIGNVLDYLLDGRPLSAEQQRNPRALIDDLINSPKGKALGQSLQATFEAHSIKGSPADWLLAALSVGHNNDAGAGQVIEGYRLVSAENSGQSASTVVKALAEHLAARGNASSPEVAAVQARLMLANRAPAFLVKDIPKEVAVGTHSWVSFATAVGRIEAEAPGATAAMSYAQIMQRASVAPITADERQVEFAAQNAAIKEWAVANGMNYPLTEAAVTEVRNAFNAQISELREAAETQMGELPTTRAIALEQLKKALPGVDPALLEEKSITLQPANRHFPGPYSLLDLFIDGRGLHGAPDSADDWGVRGREFVSDVTLGLVTLPTDGAPAAWVSSSPALDLNNALATIKHLPRPQAAFDEAIAHYTRAVKKTTSAQLKHLIAKLPLEDRQNLEFGKITVRREFDYNRSDHLLRVAEGVLLIETERDGKFMTYEVDRLKGTVTRQPGKTYKEFPPTEGFYRTKGKKYETVKPAGEYPDGITAERKGAQGAPNSFGSARTQYVVDAIIEDMDLPAVQRYAKGATTFETEVPTYKVIKEIALNLIPLRSAIQHFSEGNIRDGVVDLAFDIFGFAVGLGAAAKGAKALSVGASALSKAGHGLKIVGRAAVGALNPLGGIDDLAIGIIKGARAGAVAAYRGVNHLRGSYRSVNLLELAKKPDIAEGTYKAANSADSGKVLAKFDEATQKWYALDPRTQRAYGKSLDQFIVAPATSSATQPLHAIASADAAQDASRLHGLAASGTFKVGQETVEGNAVMFQGNWHQYDTLKKRAFGPPLKDFSPSRIAASGEVRPLNTDLLGYEAKYLDPDELSLKGLQRNVYVGQSHKEYIKVDGVLYESHLKDGQRVIRHPAGKGADIPVTDLGPSGWAAASSAPRLLGGAGGPIRWRLNESTYVVPMDGIKVVSHSSNPFRITANGVDHDVTFSSTAGAWRKARPTDGPDVPNPTYFWRDSKGKWQQGPFDEFVKARKTDSHHYNFVDVSPPVTLKIPKDLKPLPKELHYFWAGQDIPAHLADNIARNAGKAPGYKSVVHVDADSPAVFQQIKTRLESKGISVMNLQEDPVFKQLKQGEMYDYFRNGQGKNLAAASDVARYPIMNKHGGVYLDTDDAIQAFIGDDALLAGANDVLLGRATAHSLTDYKTFYNTSNFATRPGNPVIDDIITEMNKRFSENKGYFEANRPTVTRGADGRVQFTPEFQAYERKIFDTVGPNLFNDTLKSKRPDMYDLGFDGTVKASKVLDGKLVPAGPVVNIGDDVRQFYTQKGVVSPELLDNQVTSVKQHYFPLRYKFDINIGADHSWINT